MCCGNEVGWTNRDKHEMRHVLDCQQYQGVLSSLRLEIRAIPRRQEWQEILKAVRHKILNNFTNYSVSLCPWVSLSLRFRLPIFFWCWSLELESQALIQSITSEIQLDYFWQYQLQHEHILEFLYLAGFPYQRLLSSSEVYLIPPWSFGCFKLHSKVKCTAELEEMGSIKFS